MGILYGNIHFASLIYLTSETNGLYIIGGHQAIIWTNATNGLWKVTIIRLRHLSIIAIIWINATNGLCKITIIRFRHLSIIAIEAYLHD